MKIFVYEHITAGGCAGTVLPSVLLPEAKLMLNALAGDVAAFAEVHTLLDARLADMPGGWMKNLVHDRVSWELQFDNLVCESDAVWLVAPETGGVLEQLSARVLGQGSRLLGSRPHAVKVAASKLATARALEIAGVAVVPTLRPEQFDNDGPCVAKPDDGCGCEDTRRFARSADALDWIARHPSPERFVLQPYVTGDAISLSVLAGVRNTRLLSVNRQKISLRDDWFSFSGCVVNAMHDTGGIFAALAEQTVAAVPGLYGYVGIDVLLTPRGPFVLEINPRVTTSYAGLRAALGVNPAKLVLDVDDEGPVHSWSTGQAVVVELPALHN